MRVLVAGSAHIDILAQPTANSEHKDRIGHITFAVGGTACNVALCLCSAGLQVRLLTSWGVAPITKLIEGHLLRSGIELLVDEVIDMPVAAFVAQLTLDGEMQSAISSAPVGSHIFSENLIDSALNDIDYVVLEANLHPDSIRTIARLAHSRQKQVFVLGVSEDKVERILASANFIAGAFVNNIECEHLMHILESVDHTEISEYLGAPVFVTKGARGAVVYLPNGDKVRIPPIKLDSIKNTLGVGDAFSAGVIDGMTRFSYSFCEAAQYAYKFVAEIVKSDACNIFSLNAINNLVGNLYETSTKDALTGLYTRRFFEEEYDRYRSGINTILMIDCDKFKRVNDTMGHDVGDAVLRQVAQIIKDCTRSVDVTCRWGGDEFIVLLPRSNLKTGLDDAKVVAERMRSAVSMAVDKLHGVTLSIGISLAKSDEELTDVFLRADAAMYAAKKNGRDTVAYQ